MELTLREPAYLALHRTGELRRRIEAAMVLLEDCRLCPRECPARRLDGETGVCGVGRQVLIASHGPHFGEERPLVGTGGSGTIFLAQLSPNTYLNVMGQYRPCYRAHEHAALARPLARRPSGAEMERAVDLARAAGLHRLDGLC